MKTLTPTISMMKMLASVRNMQWNIMPDKIQEFALSCLEAAERINNNKELSVSIEDYYDLRPESNIDKNGIGHVWVKGALLFEYPAIYEKLGYVTRYKTIQKETKALIDSGAKGILFHVNSPGGTVLGCSECADFMMDIEIPTVAHVSGIACSAAYKLSSSCNAIISEQTAQVGNIGSILSWADCSEFWKSMGIEMKALVSEGATLKSTFHLEPNEEQIQFLQESINESGKKFRDHVINGRKRAGVELDKEVFRAGWYSGEKAGKLGLIDQIGSEEEAEIQINQMVLSAI